MAMKPLGRTKTGIDPASPCPRAGDLSAAESLGHNGPGKGDLPGCWGCLREAASVIGRSANEAQNTKQSQLTWLARNDLVQADRGQPSQRAQKHRSNY